MSYALADKLLGPDDGGHAGVRRRRPFSQGGPDSQVGAPLHTYDQPLEHGDYPVPYDQRNLDEAYNNQSHCRLWLALLAVLAVAIVALFFPRWFGMLTVGTLTADRVTADAFIITEGGSCPDCPQFQQITNQINNLPPCDQCPALMNLEDRVDTLTINATLLECEDCPQIVEIREFVNNFTENGTLAQCGDCPAIVELTQIFNTFNQTFNTYTLNGTAGTCEECPALMEVQDTVANLTMNGTCMACEEIRDLQGDVAQLQNQTTEQRPCIIEEGDENTQVCANPDNTVTYQLDGVTFLGIMKPNGANQFGFGSVATGDNSHASGFNSVATGEGAFTHGYNSGGIMTSTNEGSWTLGWVAAGATLRSTAQGSSAQGMADTSSLMESTMPGAHVEGCAVSSSTLVAVNKGAHAEGYVDGGGTIRSSGIGSHAEGYTTGAFTTEASGDGSHAEGYGTLASGDASHSEGWRTEAVGLYAHAEGYGLGECEEIGREPCAVCFFEFDDKVHPDGPFPGISSGNASHAEGWQTKATAQGSHSEGQTTLSSGAAAHAEGRCNWAFGAQSHAEGGAFEVNMTSVCGNFATPPIGIGFTATHSGTYAIGVASHAEGSCTEARGISSHAEGGATMAVGVDSHSEGLLTQAIGDYSHAQGRSSLAIGDISHAEGRETRASGLYSHAEGWNTYAVGQGSHTEGRLSRACGLESHAQNSCLAFGDRSSCSGSSAFFMNGPGDCDINLATSTGAIAPESITEGFLSTATGVASRAGGDRGRAYINQMWAHGFGALAQKTIHLQGTSTVDGSCTPFDNPSVNLTLPITHSLVSSKTGRLTIIATDNSAPARQYFAVYEIVLTAAAVGAPNTILMATLAPGYPVTKGTWYISPSTSASPGDNFVTITGVATFCNFFTQYTQWNLMWEVYEGYN